MTRSFMVGPPCEIVRNCSSLTSCTESTLRQMYRASQNLHSEAGHTSSEQQSYQLPASDPSQPSLHRFWSLPAKPAPAKPLTMVPTHPIRDCSDCGTILPLGPNDMMEMDGDDFDGSCWQCGKIVCDMCVITIEGIRECVQCQGYSRKR